MNIQIVSASLPPEHDGIADYTAQLAAELATRVRVKVLTAKGLEPTLIPGTVIEQFFSIADTRSTRNLTHVIGLDKPDWLLLQYNPFCYGRWGLNLSLPLAIREIKMRWPEVGIAVMVHEPFVPVTSWQFALMTIWQRWQLWMLGRSADVMFLSIETWARKFQRWFPNRPVRHLPVGSAIPREPLSRGEARQLLGIKDCTLVIGVFGTAHSSHLLDYVGGAVNEVTKRFADVLILYIGPHGTQVQAAMPTVTLVDAGYLAPADVSRHFAAMDIYLAPFLDGVSTRRTSFMVGLQHGIPTVSTVGFLTDEVLLKEQDKAFLLAPVGTPGAFTAQVLRLAQDAELRTHLGEAGKHLYDSTFSWDHIADRLLQVFREAKQQVDPRIHS